MSPLNLQVSGGSTIYRQAERAVVSIQVSSESESQDQVSKHVRTTSNHLRELLQGIAPKDQDGGATEDAPVTHWTMNALSTYSTLPTDKEGNKLARQYHARTTFEVKFRDFNKLGSFATSLSTMAHISITNIKWSLRDMTRDSLASQSRKMALKDAITKADDYAEVLGKKKVDVYEIIDSHYGVSTTVNSHYMGHWKRARMNTVSDVDVLSFEPEGVNINTNITVKFRAE